MANKWYYVSSEIGCAVSYKKTEQVCEAKAEGDIGNIIVDVTDYNIINQ